jgi:hypothetical protein
VPDRFLYVSVGAQTLQEIVGGQVVRSYAVSTAAKGRGCRAGSLRTPTGVHRIERRFGAGVATGAVFRSRKATGERWLRGRSGEDLVLTRILWLSGMEQGHNKGGDIDTFSRHIYIHGTNHERTIGRPASHGCIRMRNREIVELFNRAKRGTIVVID